MVMQRTRKNRAMADNQGNRTHQARTLPAYTLASMTGPPVHRARLFHSSAHLPPLPDRVHCQSDGRPVNLTVSMIPRPLGVTVSCWWVGAVVVRPST